MGWCAADYAAHAAFVPAMGDAVLALLAPEAGERILDLGCGDGVLTARLVAAGADVLGVDRDEGMLAAGAARVLSVARADGQRLGYDAAFDAVFTNAALHWMPDQAAVAAGVFAALVPGGRYVGECGGFMNIAAIRAAIRAVLAGHGHAPDSGDGQTYLTADAFGAIHAAAGFVDVDARIIARPTPLKTGIRGWLTAFRGGFLDDAGVPPHAHDAVVADIEKALAPVLMDERGEWFADYVRLRWRAAKPMN